MHKPTDAIYQEARDYWAVGVSATGFILGVEADFLPCQCAYFFAGWVGIALRDVAIPMSLLEYSGASRVLGIVRASGHCKVAFRGHQASGELVNHG